MTDPSFINNWRPTKWSEVIGQELAVRSMKNALDNYRSRSFILTGPSGVGKTTLARIAARYVGSTGGNTREIAAAITNGVDEMRDLAVKLSYRPLALVENAAKAYIVDEAHRITGPGWDALLKDVEEPPEWGYWFFCTTDFNRIPTTIKTRCSVYTLKPLDTNIIFDHLDRIADNENLPAPREVIQLCASEAKHSMRNGLAFLSVCADARTRKEAAELILAEEARLEGPGFALAQALWQNKGWDIVQPLLQQLAEPKEGEVKETAEGVRHTVRGYVTKVILGSKDTQVVAHALRILDLFSEPCNPTDGFSPIVLACGRLLFAR